MWTGTSIISAKPRSALKPTNPAGTRNSSRITCVLVELSASRSFTTTRRYLTNFSQELKYHSVISTLEALMTFGLVSELRNLSYISNSSFF
uniref:Ovule protein n=1 Tax=Angiostrongylus cantonensis TaxID=6313 RepID=A0A158P7C3_ANGCA